MQGGKWIVLPVRPCLCLQTSQLTGSLSWLHFPARILVGHMDKVVLTYCSNPKQPKCKVLHSLDVALAV